MISLGEINARMKKLNDWDMEINSIVRRMIFKNFLEAADFIKRVGEISSKFNHYPRVIIENNIVSLILTTEEVGGLSEKDFDVAEEIDKLIKNNEEDSKKDFAQ